MKNFICLIVFLMFPMIVCAQESIAVPADPKGQPWIGQTFFFYASDRQEADIVAAQVFKSKFGVEKEDAKVDLPFEFFKDSGKVVVTVVARKPEPTPP